MSNAYTEVIFVGINIYISSGWRKMSRTRFFRFAVVGSSRRDYSSRYALSVRIGKCALHVSLLHIYQNDETSSKMLSHIAMSYFFLGFNYLYSSNLFNIYMYLYRVSETCWYNWSVRINWVNLNGRVIYHFAKFAKLFIYWVITEREPMSVWKAMGRAVYDFQLYRRENQLIATSCVIIRRSHLFVVKCIVWGK